jgi:hypothetical protein
LGHFTQAIGPVGLAPGGVAEILWKESGTGEKWGIIRLPVDPVVRYDGVINQSGTYATIRIWSRVSNSQNWEDTGWIEPPIIAFDRPEYAGLPVGKKIRAQWHWQAQYLEIVDHEPGV